jgi:hypothetical protein
MFRWFGKFSSIHPQIFKFKNVPLIFFDDPLLKVCFSAQSKPLASMLLGCNSLLIVAIQLPPALGMSVYFFFTKKIILDQLDMK